MTSLVDVNNIIKQTNDIKEKELDKEEKKIESQRLIAPKKRSFWQRLFGKKNNQSSSLSGFSGNSEEELKKIIALRKELGMDDLPLPTKPHYEQKTILPIEEKSKSSSDEELSVFVKETEHEPVDIPSKDKLQNLRFKLGLDKDIINTKQLYDKLEEQSNKDLDEQSKQYDKEQSEISETSTDSTLEVEKSRKQEEQLITSEYEEPLEIEDKELFEKKISLTQDSTNYLEDDYSSKQKDSASTKETFVGDLAVENENENQNEKEKNAFEELSESEVKSKLLKNKEVKTKPLLSSNPEVFENEKADLQWSTKDETIDKEFPEESAKTLEEENFILSENKTIEPFIEPKDLSKKTPEIVSEKEENISKKDDLKKDDSKEKLQSEIVEEQLEKTSNILEELEHGEVPVEDLLHHLEIGVEQCNSMIKEKRFLDAKYKYNELYKVFKQTNLEDSERNKWFGVLRKTYDRIVEAERF